MSSLWTPGGERPVRRDTPPASEGAGSPAGGRPPMPADAGAGAGAGRDAPLSEEEMRARLSELQQQLANTPAEIVIANHAFGLFELAALHLSLDPPQLDQSRLAIDALAAIVDALGSRLGEPANQLAEGVAQLRMAYVQITSAAGGATSGGAAGG